MAVTNVHPIRSTLSKAIEYIINPDKTEKRLYVNSFGCSTDYEKAAEEFLKVRSLGSGKGNVLAQHIVQSFYGKEVTPEQAIQIGEELAEKFLKASFSISLLHISTRIISTIISSSTTSALRILRALNTLKIAAVNLGRIFVMRVTNCAENTEYR